MWPPKHQMKQPMMIVQMLRNLQADYQRTMHKVKREVGREEVNRKPYRCPETDWQSRSRRPDCRPDWPGRPLAHPDPEKPSNRREYGSNLQEEPDFHHRCGD